jgi:hypothetical protein
MGRYKMVICMTTWTPQYPVNRSMYIKQVYWALLLPAILKTKKIIIIMVYRPEIVL